MEVNAKHDAARKAGIPESYAIKNWNPVEEPVTLMGSVFDANSMGKWIYDWTVYCHGASTPMADIAGDLWLLLIKLAGKRKRLAKAIAASFEAEDMEMLREFVAAGNRLWIKFKELLGRCEQHMRQARRRNCISETESAQKAGTDFVQTVFGRELELERTENFMAMVRTWSLRLDANCEELVREAKPAANRQVESAKKSGRGSSKIPVRVVTTYTIRRVRT